jgi:hypothetical protein
MVETFFTRSCTIHGLRQGPLAGHIDLLADHLAAHGFSRVHSRIQLRLVGHFNRWLGRKGISAEQLDEMTLERYCMRGAVHRTKISFVECSRFMTLVGRQGPRGFCQGRSSAA